MNTRATKYLISFALVTAAVVSACSDVAPTGPTQFSAPRFNINTGTPGQKLVLCKEGASGTFEASLSQGALGSLAVTNPFTVNAGECVDVYIGRLNGDGSCCEPMDAVTITETSAIPVSISYAAPEGQNCFITNSGPAFISLELNTYNGCTVTFVNQPPPPPPGGDGCTPGFWKNSVGSWPAGYLPGQDFDATFGVNIFSPNISLLVALGQGGGGANALGRHAAAALLNSASDNVDYGMSTAQVIALVQSAFASGDFESAKNTLAALNETDCALPNDNSF
jgi:hypothetical protein